MSIPSSPTLRRERFLDAADPAARRLLELLLAQDGSTTKLCETIAGGPVELHLLHQTLAGDVPELVRDWLPGTHFIERVTSLVAHGEVMMDNLTFVALDGLDAALQRELEAGRVPIGHLLARLWVRREAISGAGVLHEHLWRAVGVPDAPATRAYRIVTPEGPRMLITETYRRGMRMVRGS